METLIKIFIVWQAIGFIGLFTTLYVYFYKKHIDKWINKFVDDYIDKKFF